MTYLIAATGKIYLSSIEDPMVMCSQTKKLALVFLAVVVEELDSIVAFMFVFTICTFSSICS